MAAVANSVQVTASDRLGFSIFIAAILHAMIILGLGFGVHLGREANLPSMLEVTMVLTKTHATPDDAKHIASENQLASGSSDLENQPSAPFTGAQLIETNGIAPIEMSPSKPEAKVEQQKQDVALIQQFSDIKTVDQELKQEQEKTTSKSSNAQISEQQMELAKLVAELRTEEEEYAKRPRINYIDTISAKTATEAAYVREWVDKVERVGNLNYPEEIKKSKLSGTLILSVLINHDGNVVQMEIQSSAGKSLLDESAKRIVYMATPFKTFPKEMYDKYDQLMITRTWLFGKNNKLVTE